MRLRAPALLLGAVLLGASVLPSPAQQAAPDTTQSEADKGFLTRFLEDNLSGAGRTVRIDGFAGALSSRATFTQLTIADAGGVWITIRDGAISWNRSALLSGRVDVDELSAREIDLPRAPAASSDGLSAEAGTFALPELPVSVRIGRIRADRVQLGEALLGTAATVTLDGAMQLAGGQGDASLDIRRIDGRDGELRLTAAYANATRLLTLDLLAREGAGGIAATLIGIPDQPALSLAASGRGPIDDFRADVALGSDGVPRLTGSVTFGKSASGGSAFTADLSGDVAPLFLPDYRDFFGSQLHLVARGSRGADGALDLSDLSIDSAGLDVTGQFRSAADGTPQLARISLKAGLDGASETLLPLTGEPTYIRRADLVVSHDAAAGPDWSVTGTLDGFRRGGLTVASLRLDGSGARTGTPPAAGFSGRGRFGAQGIGSDDPALAQALGEALTGSLDFDWTQAAGLTLGNLRLAGAGLAAQGDLTIGGLDSAATVAGSVTVSAADLSRFSGLARRPVSGSAALTLDGRYALLTGAFDGTLSVTGGNLGVGEARIDALLRGTSRAALSARRSTEGTEIRSLEVTAGSLTASAQGWLRDGASDLAATVDLADLSVMGGGLRGSVRAETSLKQSGGRTRLAIDGNADGLGVGQAEIDRVLAGRTQLSVAFDGDGTGPLTLGSLSLTNPQLSASAAQPAQGGDLAVELRLTDLALLAPGFPGPVSATGTLGTADAVYRLDLAGSGPGGTSATATGTYDAQTNRADLALKGTAQLAAINPFIAPRNVEGAVRFDLSLRGRPALASLSGRIEAPAVRVVDPAMRIALEQGSVSADLDGGRARVTASAAVRGGGRVDAQGSIGLAAPYPSDIDVRLSEARLRDAQLYDTRVTGTIRVSGPLDGGAQIAGTVDLSQTELRVPAAGLGANDIFLPIRNVNEPAAVRATRARAGLIEDEAASVRRRVFGLDLTVNAPNRIFVRGRGVDAEMGGTVRLAGTTDAVVPSGQFSLIRGRLDILGKRFEMDEGRVELQGALIPWVRFAATTESDGFVSTIAIEGQADQPKITFTSTPEQPEEEILARLLFGHGLSSLSVFQAAQLASAVAQLTGRGGEGILGRLRTSFGLDDLDITTDTDGNAALRFGKYITDRVYTDIEIGQDGQSEVRLNLDLTKNVTVKGSVVANGDTGIGIYYERDY
ncbi:MAG: translocation/assembly module TamB domain-containing protein [Pseudomonadota bacterium]